MKILWSALSEWVDLKKTTPSDLSQTLTSRGIEVESIKDFSQGWEKVISAKILEKKKHPNADRLSLCKVDTGSGVLEIVCGATNMKEGDNVALAQVGALLPNGMVIKAGKIRDVVSNGMLCSESELGLKDSSEGILILPANVKIGRPLAEILNREDVCLELGITPNRGDLLSHLGIAREISSALTRKLLNGEKKLKISKNILAAKKKSSPIKTAVGEGGPQFFGCLFENVQVGPSPEWLVRRLELLGQRSINNLVDATNWVMLELGHPTHAYDADKIRGSTLRIGKAPAGKKLALLDDSVVELKGGELVIADDSGPVGLAGVMGGASTAVSASTTRVFLECAEFNPLAIRIAAKIHDKKTEASSRFEKGIDSAFLEKVLLRLASLVEEISSGTCVGFTSARAGKTTARKAITLEEKFLANSLGLDVPAAKIKELLTSLGCEVKVIGKKFQVVSPSWRKDINIAPDLAEEVARSIGYEKIPSELPPIRLGEVSSKNLEDQAARFESLYRVKSTFAQMGFLEVVPYAFTSRKILQKYGQSGGVVVRNPISEEQEILVPALLPGLLETAQLNWNHYFGTDLFNLRLFELRPVYSASGSELLKSPMETAVQENWRLSGLVTGNSFEHALKNTQRELDFFDLKGMLDGFLEKFRGRNIKWKGLAAVGQVSKLGYVDANEIVSLFHPGRTACLFAGKNLAGVVGEIHPAILQGLKIRQRIFAFELDWDLLSEHLGGIRSRASFQSWTEFPGIERDFALLVKSETEVEKILQVAIAAGQPLAKNAKVFDIYQGSPVPEGMTSVAVRVIFSNEQRSLQESEADQVSAQIVSRWKESFGAVLR